MEGSLLCRRDETVLRLTYCILINLVVSYDYRHSIVILRANNSAIVVELPQGKSMDVVETGHQTAPHVMSA